VRSIRKQQNRDIRRRRRSCCWIRISFETFLPTVTRDLDGCRHLFASLTEPPLPRRSEALWNPWSWIPLRFRLCVSDPEYTARWMWKTHPWKSLHPHRVVGFTSQHQRPRKAASRQIGFIDYRRKNMQNDIHLLMRGTKKRIKWRNYWIIWDEKDSVSGQFWDHFSSPRASVIMLRDEERKLNCLTKVIRLSNYTLWLPLCDRRLLLILDYLSQGYFQQSKEE